MLPNLGVSMSTSGYIYVLINNAMENLVKVGKTSRDAESRAKELSSVTGVPTPFTVAFDAFFEDCSVAEDYVHKQLENMGYRLSSNREFFQAPLKEVINAIIDAQQVLKQHQALNEHPESQALEPNSDELNNLQDGKSEPWIDTESLANYYLISENFREAYRLYKQALELGSLSAYFWLGNMSLKGQGCLEDEKEAVEYFMKGADVGDGQCCAELSLYYFKEDRGAGLYWFEKYLKSDSLAHDTRRGHYVFHCCFNMEISYIDLKNFILKHKEILFPFKEEILSYAIDQINYINKKYPELKKSYLKVAHAIKNNL